MVRSPRNISRFLSFGSGSKYQPLTHQDVQPALDFIRAYWHRLERYHPQDDENLVGLPKPFLVPSFEEGHEFDYNELYYWDSYFMIQGVLDEEHKDLVIGVLDDLIYLFNRFKIIPNASRLYLTSRSQPPFLTSFIWDVYDTYQLDHKWLTARMQIAEAEYFTVWMGTRKPNARQVFKGLSRYYDFNYLNDIAEAESGWDMTPRFERRALDFLPVDLNALLFKYEVDFARYYRLIGDQRTAVKWEVAAKYRRETMNGLMWSRLRGMYYDYDYTREKRGNIESLASYYPLWAGLVDKDQAAVLVKSLRRFENRGGLVTTDSQPLNKYVPGVSTVPTQWGYPNGWAPLHFLVVKGLQRYGYEDDARRIAMKWLKTNLDWFNHHGVFLEKYNVVQPEKPPLKGLYPTQTGFGWTNAVFARFCKEFIPTDQQP